MQESEIFGPFIGMLLLTFVVWVVLYVRRIGFLLGNKIAAQRLTSPEKTVQLIPEDVNSPANNFKNLCELPVVFYALCLYLYVSGSVDSIYVTAAWVFLAFRVVHSVIHCTANIVMLRFLAYLASALALWFMVLRAALQF